MNSARRPVVTSIYTFPHSTAFEPYLKSFQYKVINSVLYSNTKLCKIGLTEDVRVL